MAIGYKEQSAASVPTPASGEQYTFIDSADGKLKKKLDDTSVVVIEVGSSTPDAADVTFTPAGDIIATDVQAAIEELDTEKAPLSHVGAGGISEHPVADGTNAGFMSPSDFTKLSGVANGATANDTDANLKNRANHTGTQTASTISDFNSTADARVDAGILSHVGEADPHPGYALDSDVVALQAYAVQRSNHTGSQTSATISDFTTAAKTAVVQDAISNGITDVAPSQNAVFDALALKADASHTHAAYLDKAGDTMTGPLVIEGDNNGAGLVNLKSQASLPPTPASGVSIFSSPDEMFSVRGQSSYSFKFNDQNLTEHRQIDIPDADGSIFIDPTTTNGDIIARITGVLQRIGIGNEDDILRVVSGLPSWQAENLGQDYGGGSLGNVSISGALTLSQETHYNELTILPGALINPNGFNIYCKKLIVTSSGIAGAIIANGNNGANATGTGGAGGGAALAANILGGGAVGGAGAAGTTGVGAQGAVAGASNPGNGGSGGASGASGAGTNAGAVAAAGGAVTNYTKLDKFIYEAIRGATLISGGAGGRGGNSGGGDGVNSARGAGGGGGGARVVKIYAGEVFTSASTPSGVITANGGNGGVQNNPAPAGICGGPSGGGGGGGGAIMFMYNKRTGPSVINFFSANGGTGGNGTAGAGAGVAGSGSTGGNGGVIQLFNTSTNAGLEVIGAVGAAGTAGVGPTPGVGGQGGLCQANI